MNHCRKCNIELNDNNWMPSLKKKNSRICNECHKETIRRWREANRGKANGYASKSYLKNPKKHHKIVSISRKNLRIDTIKAYGGKCVQCKIDDFEVLDIDHIYNDGAKERKQNLFAYNLYRKLKKENYPKDRYQLLCKNCNWKKELKRRNENCV